MSESSSDMHFSAFVLSIDACSHIGNFMNYPYLIHAHGFPTNWTLMYNKNMNTVIFVISAKNSIFNQAFLAVSLSQGIGVHDGTAHDV